jgi:ABC-type multidrug transport system fused ATPase/permease subunit
MFKRKSNAAEAAPTAPATYGMMAEFSGTDEIIAAAESVRAAGYTLVEAYTHIPVHGLDDALGHKPTRLPWLVLAGGITAVYGGAITEPLKILTCLGFAFMVSWQLTLACLTLAPLVGFLMVWLNRRIRNVSKNILARSKTLTQSVIGILVFGGGKTA